MQKRVFLTGLVLSLFMISFASASMTFSELKSVYSLGDTLDINIIVHPDSTSNGFFTSAIVCDDERVEIMKVPYSSVSGQEETFRVKARLDADLIGDLEGDCLIEASYEDEDEESPEFRISSSVIITVDIEGNMFEPSEMIEFSGTAVLANGQDAEGTAEVSVQKTDIKTTLDVDNGIFNGSLTLPDDIASASYTLQVIVRQKGSDGNVLNSGKAAQEFRVKQVIKAAEVALGKVSFTPGEEISYQVVLYDQSLTKAASNVNVKLISPAGITTNEQSVSSGTTSSFTTKTSDEPGEWTIEATAGNAKSTNNFNMQELKTISVLIENSTIIVTNSGNVPYDGTVEINVDDKTETFPVSLAVSAEKKYRVYAPDGNHEITVKTSEQSVSLGSNWLTGKAIKITDADSEQGAFNAKTWLWGLLVIVLAGITYLSYRRYSANRVYSSPSSASIPRAAISKAKDIKQDISNAGENFMWRTSSSEQNAAQNVRKLSDITTASSLMKSADFGKKDECTVIALKIKNNDELTKYKNTAPAMDALVQIAGLARKEKAQITREGNYTVMIFSRAATGSQDAHLLAVKTAKEMEALLKSHNRKHARKIAFGIGAVTGEMIIEKNGSSINHTSVGTIIPSAKKIAEHAHDTLLISDATRSKLRGQIKVDKDIGGIYWSVQSFVNHERHNEFINKFMQRRADESKSF